MATTSQLREYPDLANEGLSRSSQFIRTQIPGAVDGEPGRAGFSVYGEAFYVIACGGDAWISTDKSGAKPYPRGTGERFPSELRFKRLEFENKDAEPITLEIWAGFGEYVDARAEVLDARTEAKGSTITTIPANSGVTFSGARSGAYRQRKYVAVSNNSYELDLQLRDKDGVPLQTIFARNSAVYDLSGAVTVFNPNPAAVAVCMGEVFYTS